MILKIRGITLFAAFSKCRVSVCVDLSVTLTVRKRFGVARQGITDIEALIITLRPTGACI